MPSSIFGSFFPRRGSATDADDEADFAPTAMLESLPPDAESARRRAGTHARDIIVSDPPGTVVRQQLVHAPAGAAHALGRIALFDPGRLWAGTVIKMLAESSGEPVERIYLRREDTLATLALMEITLLPRRLREPLQVCHAEVRATRSSAGAVPLALMESAHLTVVIVSQMTEPVLESLLSLVQDATLRPHWRCPNLLFLLAPSMAPQASRIIAVPWQARLNVHTCSESLSSASAVWNAVLQTWNRVKHRPQWVPSPAAGVPVANPALRPEPPRLRPDLPAMSRALQGLAQIRGVHGAAVVDGSTGLVLEQQLGPEAGTLDLERAAAALTEVLRTHRRAARECSPSPRVEEVLVTQAQGHQLLRILSAHPELFLFVLLERCSGNLAQVREAVARADRELA